MSMDLRIGCSALAVKEDKYYKCLKLVEVSAKSGPAAGLSKLKHLRSSSPDDFEFILNTGNILIRTWEEISEEARALKTNVIFFQSPASFKANAVNKEKLKNFFVKADRKRYNLAWEAPLDWPQEDIREMCGELGLAHSVDPFKARSQGGSFRYFRMNGIGSSAYKYKGWDLKQLKDFCENESQGLPGKPVYVIFSNEHMLNDALRFSWIVKNTGRIKEMDLSLLKDLCRQIEIKEECEKATRLNREAEKIVALILYTDYAKVDIEIESGKLRDMCAELFPGKEYLYDMIYKNRFERIWKQFREGKKMEEGL